MKYKVIVKHISPKLGKGVFATKNFKEGEVIERCPVLKLTPKERKQVEKTEMLRYIYPWRSTRSAAVVWGYGSLYNHSFAPNADWKQDFRSNNMVYRAIKSIKKGEEILINYNGEPDDATPIEWFPDN
ncbi:SET domain-containing protein [Candidatus Microgenomates bacterium]|nr:SET domain-containing protein [Candidatus Microgenomates bacterium]